MNLMGPSKQKDFASSCILLVMVLAFAIKAMLPAGFMPVINTNGFTELVICSGMGEKTILVPADENDPSDNQDNKRGELCAYQSVTSNKTLLSPPVAFIPAPNIVLAVFEKPVDVRIQQFINLDFTPRGPPSLLI